LIFCSLSGSSDNSETDSDFVFSWEISVLESPEEIVTDGIEEESEEDDVDAAAAAFLAID